MLRTVRPLLASSSRAIASTQAPISSLYSLPTRTTNPSKLAHSTVPRTLISQIVPLLPKSRYVTKSPSGLQQGRDPDEEKKFAEKKLEPHPEAVTSGSSVRHLYEPSGNGARPDVKDDVKADLETVKDTFALSSVPKESYYLGLAGTLPYLATSLSTVYLSWDLNTAWPSTSGFVNSIMISHETARHLLNVIEPIQLGYGAIIISFLGAIHWGLEYAEKVSSRERTRFRYGLGVLASVVAWPTLFMPTEFALTQQFAAFVGLYFADSRATTRGWAPPWYGTYRFVLSAVVGAAIVISLIGRSKVGDAQPRLTDLDEKFHEHQREEPYSKKWQALETKEKQKIQKEKDQEEQEQAKEAEEKAKKGGSKNEGKNKNSSEGKGDDEKKDEK
ncbi:hypothetical protein F4779DRAFT_585615 [Xylariaceae sp. FL0662B]|nr:hypothetical protein F4779DRAFT_585615 [Xylariaceae sp. FL0662B]